MASQEGHVSFKRKKKYIIGLREALWRTELVT